MFIVGKEYRVWSLKDGMGSREGVMIKAEGPMFILDCGGIQTTFHMATVAYLELVDREAEDARQLAEHAKRVEAWS